MNFPPIKFPGTPFVRTLPPLPLVEAALEVFFHFVGCQVYLSSPHLCVRFFFSFSCVKRFHARRVFVFNTNVLVPPCARSSLTPPRLPLMTWIPIYQSRTLLADRFYAGVLTSPPPPPPPPPHLGSLPPPISPCTW